VYIFKTGKSVTLSVRLTAGLRRSRRPGFWHAIPRIVPPVAWVGGMRVGKGKGYNHVRAVNVLMFWCAA